MPENIGESAQKSMLGDWRPIRLLTLVRLRWLAVSGQAVSVLVVALGLRFPLPLLSCFALIRASAALNVGLQVRFGSACRLTNFHAGLLLGFDCLQLAGLLWLTGGLANPFSLLLLAPISVSATTLDQRATFALSTLIVLLATLLALTPMPLPWSPDQPQAFHRSYIGGIWVALLLGVAFIAAYTNRVAHEARQLADALSATELALSRQQQLHALDGLAAAAAHELGTPLSTIALVAKEMRGEAGWSASTLEDLDLILEQITRCRAILGKLRSLEAEGGDPFAIVPLTELLAEVSTPHEQRGKLVLFETDPQSGGEPRVARSVGLLYGLGNLVENAVQFARTKVVIGTVWAEDAVTLTITDDGPGFSLDLIDRLGEPYLTSRDRGPATDAAAPGGLGLGVFIAKTLLERTGARLSFTNSAPQGHAQVRITWLRSAMTESAARV